jgi:hypothetical protein
VRPATAPSVKGTYEDFLDFPDDGKRHEIIDGEHFVTPSPNVREYWVVDPDLDAIRVYRRTDGAFTRAAEPSAAMY